MLKVASGVITGIIKRPWKLCSPNPTTRSISVRIKVPSNCGNKRPGRAIRRRHGKCKRPNKSYSPDSGKAHEGGGNDGRMESSGKPNPGFPTAFHRPWESLARFPHFHRPGDC